MKTKIEIKSIYGSVLFSFEKKENTVKETIKEAIKSGADLRRAYLSGSDLSGADLIGADLSGADLRRADLSGSDLSGARLIGADLRRADLSGADLIGADFRRAHLSGADLMRANYDESTAFLLSQCPSEGSFIAWKKANGMIIKLEICKNAKRSSATTLKCRCSSAMVLEIQNIDGTKSELMEVASEYDPNFIYRVGEVASVDDFNEDRFNECSTGIHFFISREMAVKC